MLFAALVKSAWIPGDEAGTTSSVLFKHLQWSLAACGDLDELCNQYGLRHFNANEPCFWCSADCEHKPWSDFAPTAAWRGTLVTEEEAFMPSAHPLWSIPGLNVYSVGWDMLHGLDLGPCAHVIGNVLDDLSLSTWKGTSADVFEGLMGLCSLVKTSLGQWRPQMAITVKFHYVAHAAEHLVWANPKFTSTYPGESYVGGISKVALSAALGKPVVALGGLLMSKVQASRAVKLRKQLV